jgi:acyl-CoA reductase-like NAD-dependent aldehyde dehydrogenase
MATIVAETGFTVSDANGEVDRCFQTLLLSAEEAKRVHGEMVPLDGAPGQAHRLGFTIRVPRGVVVAITPFNSPLNTVAHKIAPALAAGCAVVLKPAGQTPLSALTLAELEDEAGLPAGWLNVLVGPASEIGDVLVEDERVKAITFTGSSEVGWGIRERAARKKVLLELGNATPVIVHDDADVAEAATKLAAHAFSFAGQSCISVQRIYVQKRVYDEFVAGFLPQVEELVVGDPADAETDVGPVIDEGARERILSWIDEARDGGAEVLVGGDLDGDLIRPTVIANAAPDLKVCREEVFGPVCVVNTYESLDEAIALANGTRYGLQAGIFTADIRAALKAARNLEFGGVTVNEAPTFRSDQMPYGGVKDSGNTREGPAYSVRELTEQRVVIIDL